MTNAATLKCRIELSSRFGFLLPTLPVMAQSVNGVPKFIQRQIVIQLFLEHYSP
jgi:hypothetical protein